MLLRLGSKPVLVISSADAAEEALRKHDIFFASRPSPSFAGKLVYNFSNIAFAPYGEYWRQATSVCVLQLLSNKRVQSFKSVREEEVAKMLGKLRESCLWGSAIRMSKILATYANDIITQVAIGKRYSSEKDGNKFQELYADTTVVLGCFNIADHIPWLGWMNHINGLEAKLSRVTRKSDKYLENIVEERLKKLEKRVSNDEETEAAAGNNGKQNLVDVLLQVQRENDTDFSIGRDSVKAIILDTFFGGTDTTYSLLEWAFSELLSNPNAMSKLQNEVRKFSNHITEDDLEKLPYLKAVIKETFHMHPPVPLVPRASRSAVKVLGYDIPAKAQVFINVWAIGRDPQSWEEADEFRPERFLNSPVDFKGQHFEFIPFGSGRRICPGYGFGLLTAELALANLVRNFNFALADGERPEDLDITEAYGLVMPRKLPLLLIASLPN